MLGKIVLVVYKNRKIKGKDGKEFTKSCYFFQPENGKRIPIQPCFKDGYALLNYVCEKEYDESEDKA